MSATDCRRASRRCAPRALGDAAIDDLRATTTSSCARATSGMLARERHRARRGPAHARRPPRGGDPASLDRAVVLKLNGGLGTSMGMTKAKSLLEAKDGRDLPRHHRRARCSALRERSGARLPLVLMNSFATRDDSLAALAPPPGDRLRRARRTSCRTRCPSSTPTTCSRSTWPRDPALEWAPPGHGDLYTALRHLGDARRRCSTHGYRYAFVSNSDNLGAVLEPRILAWIAREELPFVDGGRRPHRRRPQGRPPRPAPRDGGLVLREIAQTPDEDLDAFQDIDRHRYFNTNTLWVDLRRAARRARGARRRARPADDRQPQDGRPVGQVRPPAVIQLETAMGAAIDVFDGRARAARRPRGASRRSRRPTTCSRCAPTPTCCTDDAPRRAGARARRRRRSSTSTPTTTSCSADFEPRFPARRAVAARRASASTVTGDVTFGRDVVVRGARDGAGARAHRGRDDPVRIAVCNVRRIGNTAAQRPRPQPSGMARGRFLRVALGALLVALGSPPARGRTARRARCP